MQVSLTPTADQLVTQLLALGYDDPAQLIEIALERMVQTEIDHGSPEYVAWIQNECATALEKIDRGETVAYDLEKIKTRARQNLSAGRTVKNSVTP
jgi:hypothetical protein